MTSIKVLLGTEKGINKILSEGTLEDIAMLMLNTADSSFDVDDNGTYHYFKVTEETARGEKELESLILRAVEGQGYKRFTIEDKDDILVYNGEIIDVRNLEKVSDLDDDFSDSTIKRLKEGAEMLWHDTKTGFYLLTIRTDRPKEIDIVAHGEPWDINEYCE